jgi:energy-coupling factor transport system ATP-binding protein
MEKIAQYSERVVLLDGGELIAIDTPQSIFSREDLTEHGVEAPVYTQICKILGLKNKITGYYPVTLAEARELFLSEGRDFNL